MSNGDRHAYLTLALASATVFVISLGLISTLLLEQYAKVHQTDAAYQEHAERKRHEAREEIAEACRAVTGEALLLCVAERYEAYQEQHTSNENLKAQKDIAFWTRWLFYSSVILPLFVIFLLWRTLIATQAAASAAIASVDAATNANVTTREVAESQARSYVSVIRADIQIDQKPRTIKGFEHVDVKLHFHNSGTTPAVNVSYFCHAETSRFELTETFTPLEVVHSQIFINNIPPNETVILENPTVYAVIKEIWNVKETWKNYTEQTPIAEIPVLLIKGVVFYEDVFGKTFRSHFCFWLENQPGGEKEFGQDDMPTIQARVPTFEQIENRDLFVKYEPEEDQSPGTS